MIGHVYPFMHPNISGSDVTSFHTLMKCLSCPVIFLASISSAADPSCCIVDVSALPASSYSSSSLEGPASLNDYSSDELRSIFPSVAYMFSHIFCLWA